MLYICITNKLNAIFVKMSMYKIDLKTLKKITKTLDALSGVKYLSLEKTYKFRVKAIELSQKIKNNYTQIK